MDEFQTDDPTEAATDDLLATDPGPAWSGISRGPRPPAEGVRIIGAEEAAAAIESGHVSPRVPDDAPRFGDVPEQPSGPQPPLRFPGPTPRRWPSRRWSSPTAAGARSAGVRRHPSWAAAFDARPLGADDPSAFWDPPVVATAPPGRFEELVAAAAKAEAEAPGVRAAVRPGRSRRPGRRRPSCVRSPPTVPLTSDPVSGEWAVASGLGGNVGPLGRGRA